MNPYDFAIQMSRDGEKFFCVLRRWAILRPFLRRILVMLARDQATRRRDFAKLRREEGSFRIDDRNLAGALNPFARRIERLAAGDRLDGNLSSAGLRRRGQTLAGNVRISTERGPRG